ncbi:DNA/RNA endonuclease [Xylophilus rhododendri]|uniref:Serine protease n=1 Tax=Xylophilus rhododendri TaxID=2697032 RepID=A0A857J2Z7_9BURK|nr:DNA/RNA non-specific endonuclease [Xylophilus rhododendri]QHI97412.1 DNA/RNA endonuclease [Xylophilus rhododendri]
MDADALKAFQADVARTADERRKTRQLVAAGRWRDAEPDTGRARSYAVRHRSLMAAAGAESITGNTEDFLRVAFLSRGATVGRAVAYVEVSDGQKSEIGTGFMVSPRLFITNRHVIADAAAARGTQLTFFRELDERGVPRPSTTYLLDPDAFALFSPEDQLDYALVALGQRQSGLAEPADLGFCALSDQPDKHVIGMSTNIVQHPSGWPKMISVRNNILTARTDRTLLYETDTEQGSSGSPVFNDDWQLVALHHWGEPFTDRSTFGDQVPRNVNEGIRISAIYRDLAARLDSLPEPARTLLQQALQAAGAAAAQDGPPTLSPPRPVLSPARTLRRGAEAVQVDQDYANRQGFDTAFIDGLPLPLPQAGEALARRIAPLRAGEADAASGELKYEHFSLKLDKGHRIAMFTATNIDGRTYLEVDRQTGQANASEGEVWFKDPRVSASFFLDQTFYSAWSTYFDRGHLTRRSDPTWGTAEEAARANADTFHFSNCSPQHFRFNESAVYWQGLERYVLENGVLDTASKGRLCVFQGPVFDDRIDLWADDVQIPSSFFKIVVWKGPAGARAVGLVVDQLKLLAEARHSLGAPQPLASVQVNHWRVPIEKIEAQTGLDFGETVRSADTIRDAAQPHVGEARLLITGFEAIRL